MFLEWYLRSFSLPSILLGKKYALWSPESSLKVLECGSFQHRGSRKSSTDDLSYKFQILLCRMHFKVYQKTFQLGRIVEP